MIELNKDQQIKLLRLARNTIGEYFNRGNHHTPEKTERIENEFSEDIFKKKCGGFVTLHIKGNLRGCIGYIKGIKTIPETIIEMAKAAAFQDPRFPPLTQKEFDLIDIEISVLSPIEQVMKISEIVVGRDGLIISNGFSSGLLLPQVATEYGWDVTEFLQHTCYKAGLSADAWRDTKNTKIEKFSAQVFGEKEL